MHRAVFLDRDGVINRAIRREGKPYSPNSEDELEILPGVFEALTNLATENYYLIVVTNQPDVARGVVSRSLVERMNDRLRSELPLSAIFTCFHDDADGCNCRKPRPGLLIEAASKFKIDLTTSYMIGDRWRDIEAGRRAGCRTFFVDYGYAEKQPESYDFCVGSLLEAARIILQ